MSRFIKLSFLLTIIFFGKVTNGQEYVPFPSDSAVWTESVYYFSLFTGWYSDTYEISGDTIISDVSFQKVYINAEGRPDLNGTHYVGAIREEDRKVMFKPDSIFIHDPESPNSSAYAAFPVDSLFTLYDFQDINVGDTLNYPSSQVYEAFGYNYVVNDLFQENIGGIDRTVYQLSYSYEDWSFLPTSGPFSYIYFIEGIGSSNGLFSPYRKRTWENNVDCSILTCYEDSATFWENDFHDDDLTNEILQCDIINTSIEEINNEQITVYPNPASSLLSIDFSSSMRGVKGSNSIVTIRNNINQIINEQAVNRSQRVYELDVSDLEQGIYYLSIRSENNQVIYSQKLAVE